jgi:hypothetical protein
LFVKVKSIGMKTKRDWTTMKLLGVYLFALLLLLLMSC